MEINLKLLEKVKLDVNEYLTLVKVKKLEENDDIPFRVFPEDIELLVHNGYLIEEDDRLFLSDKSNELLGVDKITEIINYFKEVSGRKKTSESSPSNRRFVRDRLEQGYTIDDLKAVIDFKTNEWKDNSMSSYIRLATFFNETNFQKYIGEVESENRSRPVISNKRRI